MKKFLLFLALSASLISFTTNSRINNSNAQTSQDSVYICKSSSAYAYHSTLECRGLQHCTHGIIKVSLYDAIHVYGHRACKICE
jgi:hypothetical protein